MTKSIVKCVSAIEKWREATISTHLTPSTMLLLVVFALLFASSHGLYTTCSPRVSSSTRLLAGFGAKKVVNEIPPPGKKQHNNPSHNLSGHLITLLTTIHHPFTIPYSQTLRHLVHVVVELRIQLAVNHITQGKLFHQHLPRRYDPDSLLYTTRS